MTDTNDDLKQVMNQTVNDMVNLVRTASNSKSETVIKRWGIFLAGAEWMMQRLRFRMFNDELAFTKADVIMKDIELSMSLEV